MQPPKSPKERVNLARLSAACLLQTGQAGWKHALHWFCHTPDRHKMKIDLRGFLAQGGFIL